MNIIGPLFEWFSALLPQLQLFGPNGLLVQGFIVVTGIIGQQYVCNLNVRGFYFWLASNIALVAVSLYFGSYGMVCLYTYFGFMSLKSIHTWKLRLAADNTTVKD